MASWLSYALLLVLLICSEAQPVKRSLSALARTSQLPHSSTNPADQSGHDQDSHGSQPDKRSVAALARAGELPQAASSQQKRESLGQEALREAILRQRAADALYDLYGDEYGVEVERRSLSSLARHGNLPAALQDSEKRSVASLVRSGNLPLPADKRSVEALARSGLLSRGGKRSVSALARAGELPGKRWSDALDMKRSLQSLARSWNLPDATPKRSPPYGAYELDEELAELGKRNVAALLRQTKFSSGEETAGIDDAQDDERESEMMAGSSDKRYLGALRAGQDGRRKRSIWGDDDWGEDLSGEVAAPYVQAEGQQDWEELLEAIAEGRAAPQKRFLGSVARAWGPMNSWRPAMMANSDTDGFSGDVSKRHIGALARLGLLPSFRSLRALRYSRSGRAANWEGEDPAPGPVRSSRWHRVCYFREDPEYGTASTKDKRGQPEAAAPPLG